MKVVLKKLQLLLLAVFVFTSCNNEDVTLDDNEVISEEQLNAMDEVDLISEEVNGVVEDVYAADEIATLSRSNYVSDYLPDCVTITRVITSTTKELTIEFADNCELRNGNVVSGTIYLSYSKDMEAMTKVLTFSLENFVFNGVSVEGSSSITRMRSNENGNPQSTAEARFGATWPNGDTASFIGTRTREWIEGYGSGTWGDNVFLITGNATYTNRLGNTWKRTVLTALRRELACRFLVSGVLEISRNGNAATIDFGDGSCDNKAVITYPDGTTKEINLRRFRD
ncbi:hypothetical protein [Ascidiimonas sp. W6]|uniref:hypothetical protein n=1 Tax=Ascidiimonas meishanensis TaxID=3128903 RepID=UPI0030ECED73